MDQKINKVMNDLIRGKQADSQTEQTLHSNANAGNGTGKQIVRPNMNDLIRRKAGR